MRRPEYMTLNSSVECLFVCLLFVMSVCLLFVCGDVIVVVLFIFFSLIETVVKLANLMECPME